MSRRDWLFGLILIAVTMLVYLPAWNGKPIWDDEIHFTAPALRSVHGLARIWTEPSAAPQYYPVLHTIFWLEYKLWDGWTLPYHLLTILLHAVLALLIFQILRKLGVLGAWLAAFVFALHPVHVESVAWLSEIKNTLSGVFAAVAMLAYLNYEKDRQLSAYLLALVVFVIGLLTKTAIVALPVVLLAVAWWKRGKLSWVNDVKPLTPFFGVALLFGLVTVWVEQTFCVEHGETFPFSFIDRCLTAGRLFWFYLGNLFWPANLTIIYPRWTISARSWWQYGFPFATIALLVGLWIIRDKSQTGQIDEAIASYRRALELEPDFLDAHTNLANLLLEKGDIENALGHYRQALRLEPDSPMTHYNLAVGLARNGQRDQAVAELQTVLKLQSDYPDARELPTTLQQNR
jgi:hypothetical protein